MINLRGNNLYTKPFPHIIIENCLPWNEYWDLANLRPVPVANEGEKFVENERLDLGIKKAITFANLPEPWLRFMNEHTTKEWWLRLAEAFHNHLNLFSEGKKRSATDFIVGRRFMDEAHIHMDCQVSTNMPLSTMMDVRGPHRDDPKSIFAGMLYMRHAKDYGLGGDLVLHHWLSEPRFNFLPGAEADFPTEVDPNDIGLSKIIPYMPNTFVAFINSPYAIHSVSPRHPSKYHRLFINFVAEVHSGEGDAKISSSNGL